MPLDLVASARHLDASPTLAGNERVLQLRQEGRTIYHLGFGESRFPVHPRILAALRQHADARAYPPVQGLPALREAIAAFYGREFNLAVEPARVLVGPGSKSLLFTLLQLLEGDLLLPRPSWVSYEPLARRAGKQVSWIDTSLEEEFCLTPERLLVALERAREAGQRPRLLILNSPGNPTGVVYPAALLEGLAGVAREQGLTIISDEIYALVNHGLRPHTSMATYYPEGTVITGGLSKHLSLGGWRFGLSILPPGNEGAALMRAMVALASELWSGVAAPIQHAATVAYSDDPEIRHYIHCCATVHGALTHALYEELRGAGIPCAPPFGAFYLYPTFNVWREALKERCAVATSTELAELLLEEHGIATLPGTAFGAQPDDLTLRLATSYLYGDDERRMEAMLRAVEAEREPARLARDHCPELYEVGRRFRALIQSLS